MYPDTHMAKKRRWEYVQPFVLEMFKVMLLLLLWWLTT